MSADLRRDLNNLEHLFRKYNLVSVTIYAKIKGRQRKQIYRMIEDGRLMTIRLGGTQFIITPKY